MLAHPFTRPKASSISCLSRALLLAMADVATSYPRADFLHGNLRDLIALGTLRKVRGRPQSFQFLLTVAPLTLRASPMRFHPRRTFSMLKV